MKNLKGIICVLLVLAVLVLPVYADGPVIVSLEDTSVRAGEQAEVIVKISNNPGVSGASFTVVYDAEDIRLKDIVPIASGSFAKNLPGSSFSWLKGTNISGEFALAKLIFETDAEAFGQYELGLMLKGGLSGNLTNEKSEAVEAAFSGGVLTVERAGDGDATPPTGGAPGGGSGEDAKPDTGKEPCEGGDDCLTAGFSDLKSDAWYHEAVDYVIAEGILTGVGDGAFAPSMPTSRAMVVTMLYRLAGEPSVQADMDFDDVAPGKWYSDAVLWASANGIVEGYGEGIFGPHYQVTREQMAAIFYRWALAMGADTSASADISGYEDADGIHPWAREAMEWACGIGLMEGRSAVSLSPGGTSMRSETATLIWRWCNEINI